MFKRTTVAPVVVNTDFTASSGTSTVSDYNTDTTAASPTTTVLTTLVDNLVASTTTMAETTTNPETVRIYDVNYQSPVTPRSVTNAIMRSLAGESEDDQPRTEFIEGLTATSGADATYSTSFADAVMIAAAAAAFVYYVNGMVKRAYSHAVYESDPRLIATNHREDSRYTRMWSWAARAMETCWVPLWFDHHRLREESFDQALEDSANRTRIRQPFLASLSPGAEDPGASKASKDETAERRHKEDKKERYVEILMF